MNELDSLPLKQLWQKAIAGHDHCDRFSEYGVKDENYQGLAMAKSMKNLKQAIEILLDEERRRFWKSLS